MALIGGSKQTQTPPAAPAKATPATPPKAAPAAPKAETKPEEKRTRKPLELDLSGLVVEAVTDRQEMAKARQVRERTPEQKRLDAMVEAAWKAWEEAGKPTDWPKMPGVRLTISEAKHESLVAGIRKAGQFWDLKVRFGRPIKDGNGNVQIVFVAMTRKDDDDTDDDTTSDE